MNKIKLLILLLYICCCVPTIVIAQNDIKTMYALARQAKNSGQNEKAIQYFENLLNKTKSEAYYNELLELYPLVNDLEAAEKLVKKRIRRFPKKAELLIDRGHIYDLLKDEKEANKSYEKAVEAVNKNEQQSRNIAFRFNKYKLYDYVEKTYLRARRQQNNSRLFRFELANAYAQQGKTEEMIEEYFSILATQRSYLQTVQNILHRVLNPDPDGTQMDRLKEQLLGRIQKDPNQQVFSELLVWLYLQDQNFTGAFIQAKAIDRKANEQGKRLFSLGELCLSNKEYKVAEQSFQYVLNIGEKGPYYQRSKMKLVDVLRAKVTDRNDYTPEDLQKLKSAYESTLEELGRNAITSDLLRGLAELNAYYLDSINRAINILNEVIPIVGLSKQERARTKIELADLYLLSDEVWEASLLYSQVEKEFKYDRIGEIAKYKNAKIAFYTGDFFWAQAQLDVLKGSTSKLISNDAMDLSLLITDNVGLDSIIEPLQMFAVADLLIFKKDYDEAQVVLDSIPKFFPTTSLKDDILFTKYKIAFEQRSYELAADKLRELIAEYPDDLLGDDALFSLARLEEEYLNNKEKAMELYKNLLTTYPSSLFVVEARKRFRKLRGDNIEEKIN